MPSSPMSKIRIHELAKEYGMSGKSLARELRSLGYTYIKSSMTSLDEFEERVIRETLEERDHKRDAYHHGSTSSHHQAENVNASARNSEPRENEQPLVTPQRSDNHSPLLASDMNAEGDISANSSRTANYRPPSNMFGLLAYSIKLVVAVFTLSIWVVVGFLFWVPLLARATTSFTVSTTYANLVSRGAQIPNGGLEHATLFYVSGFRSILESIFLPPMTEEISIDFHLGRFLLEISWSLFFWYATLMMFSSFGLLLLPFEDTYLSLPWLWGQLTSLFAQFV